MFLGLLCESEVSEDPEEIADVNPLLGVMMYLCSETTPLMCVHH